MADPRFFRHAGALSLADILRISGAQCTPEGDKARAFDDVAPLHAAGAQHISFLDNKKYLEAFRQTRAGACFVRPEFAAQAPAATLALVHANPYKAFALTAAAFYPEPLYAAGRHPSAVIDPSAHIANDVAIGPGVIIGARADIGSRVRLGAYTVIGEGVVIGDGCDIAEHVTVSHAVLGKRVRLHPGVRIGQPGFGFAIDKTGFTSVPQLGRVLIEDDVDIGANTTIDRGAGPDTVVGQGTRIDNLVQIGHNVKIGKFCVIVAQVGISGSTEIGDFTMLGGQVGIAGHLKIGSRAKIAAQSGVLRDVASGEEVMGYPAIPLRQFMRHATMVQRMLKRKTDDTP